MVSGENVDWRIKQIRDEMIPTTNGKVCGTGGPVEYGGVKNKGKEGYGIHLRR